MKALTVQQPWAAAIATGAKTVENRTWATKYRGRISIHAGTRWSERGGFDMRIAGWHGRRMFGDRFAAACHPLPHAELFPTGVIIATAELADCHPDTGCCEPWGESSYDDRDGTRRVNVHHWLLEDVKLLAAPITARGALGLWTVPPDIEKELSQ